MAEVNNEGAKSAESECYMSTDETRRGERTDEKDKIKQKRKLKVNRGKGNR